MEFSTGYQGKSIKMFNHKINEFFFVFTERSTNN